MASPDQLKHVLSETLSPDANVRRNAEKHLSEAVKVAGHPLQVLQIVANTSPNPSPAEAAVRQASAVHFKNVVKKGWDTNQEEGNDGIVISPSDRNTIKSHLIQLMVSVPKDIQAQISEAISLIAKVDYPGQWDNLLPELVQQFGSSDPNVVIGVLKTADGIFKRFRYVGRSDELYTVIKYTLERIQAPLLNLFIETGKAVDAFANDPAQLAPRLECLRIMNRIFYSLNYQDVPEFFEDHSSEWMGQFSKYLQYTNPCVTDADEETEPGPIDTLQSAIIQNLDLYASKDEEFFMPFLGDFTKLVWNLLMTVSSYPKHDNLATTSIRFLSSLVSKLMHKALFQDESTLREIVLKIVIPNSMFRESDEELFEDDPREYIVTEVEGSDSESRRRCSQDLLRSMCRQFEAQTTAICSEHIGVMLSDYGQDPNSKWAMKDAAIHLMMGISVRKESSSGVSETNDAVNIMDFFTKQILPELQDTNHASRPVVKATALKFVATFRNQFSRVELQQLFPLIVGHLRSPTVVVHTFAAYAIERILVAKEEIQGSSKQAKFGKAELTPFLEPLFTSLFGIIDNTELNENDYVMKCTMRSLAVAESEVVAMTQILIEKLTGALARVAKNPRNPQFNHFLFESIAVLVRSVCSVDPSAAPNLEQLLFVPFQTILQMEIAEFTPYVFQILAQLLEYRTSEDLGIYQSLSRPLLTPGLWETRGNVPALTRLMQAYLLKATPFLVQENLLQGLLGCFQKMLCSPATEVDAFNLLNSMVLYVPLETMRTYHPTIFQLLLTSLQSAKGKSQPRFKKFARQIVLFFAMFVAKHGTGEYFAVLDGIQAGVGITLIAQVWLNRISEDTPKGLDAKTHVIALTKLLCETPNLLNDQSGQQLWCAIFLSASTVLAATALAPSSTDADADLESMLNVEVQYDAAFSGLVHAKKQVVDPFPEIPDAGTGFSQAVQGLAAAQPGRLAPLIQESLRNEPKLAAGIQSLFQKNGVQIS